MSFDRERALDIGLRIFWERGYEGTSVADLTAAMKITPPSLYTAFGSKEGLYREALERYGSSYAAFVLTALQDEPTARGAIRRLLSEAADFYSDGATPAGCMIATAAQYCGLEHAPIARLLAEKRLAIITAIEIRLQRGIDEGELDVMDVATAARFVAAVMQGLSVQAKDGLDSAALTRLIDFALACCPAVGQA